MREVAGSSPSVPTMKKALALFLAAAMSCTLLAGCGQDNTAGETTDTGDTTETSDLVYAVEAGSAGEATEHMCRFISHLI